MKRQEKAGITRSNILLAATELFSQKSFDDVSITEITERADCSVGAFYGHFKSKQEVATTVWVSTMVDTMKRDTEGARDITEKEALVDYLLERSEASTVNPIMNHLSRYCALTDSDHTILMTYALRYQSLIKNMLAANAPGVSEETLWSYASVIHALLNAASERNSKATALFSFTHDILRQTILMVMENCQNNARNVLTPGLI